jgi:hypothetical protein
MSERITARAAKVSHNGRGAKNGLGDGFRFDALERRVLFAAGPTIAAPGSTVSGATLGEWAARYQQWACSFPNSESPVTDTSGQYADLGQDGPTYFLAGTWLGGEPVSRKQVHVPSGANIFFPIANVFWVQLPEDPPTTVAERRGILDDFLDSSNQDIAVTIDGEPVANPLHYREVDPFTNTGFDITLPADNVFVLFGATPAQAPAGTYPGSVVDGYYLMLTDMPNGNHTLHWSAPGLGQDITYQIQVVGEPLRADSSTQGIFGDDRIGDNGQAMDEPIELLV